MGRKRDGVCAGGGGEGSGRAEGGVVCTYSGQLIHADDLHIIHASMHTQNTQNTQLGSTFYSNIWYTACI